MNVVEITTEGPEMYADPTDIYKFYDGLDCPVVETAIGPTGYLDCMTTADFKAANSPVVKGKDEAGRHFIGVLYIDFERGEKGELVSECFFQRYSNDGTIWTSGGYRRGIVSSRLTQEELECLIQLVEEGTSWFPHSGERINLFMGDCSTL